MRTPVIDGIPDCPLGRKVTFICCEASQENRRIAWLTPEAANINLATNNGCSRARPDERRDIPATATPASRHGGAAPHPGVVYAGEQSRMDKRENADLTRRGADCIRRSGSASTIALEVHAPRVVGFES
jgi:hypothetical protein